MKSATDVLLGLLAIRVGLARADQVAAAETSRQLADSLAERLERRGVITPVARDLLESLQEELVRAAGGDPAAAIEALGAGEPISEEDAPPGDPGRPPRRGSLEHDATLIAPSTGAQRPTPRPASGRPDRTTGSDSVDGVTREHDGRYRLPDTPELGRGGIGRILIGFDEHVGREIAIKELLPHVAGDASARGQEDGAAPAVQRFLREARVTGQLEHPNIIPIYELGQRADGSLYYTMKLVRGRTFDEALRERRTLAGRLELLPHFVDLCQALAYAHSRGVVHRDVKPQNVMVGEFGETVVLDWGLAKVKGQADPRGDEMQRRAIASRDSGETVAGSAIGTPAYMSPEQAEGEVARVDERSDVWGLGAVLYQMLVGRPPFAGANALLVLEMVRSAPVIPPGQLVPDAPSDLAAVAMKALARDPADRYQSARELATEVESFLSGARVDAYAYGSWELLRRFVQRRKAISAIVGLLFAVLVVGTVVIYAAYRRSDRSRRNAVAERERARAAERRAQAAKANALARRREAQDNLAAAFVHSAQHAIEKRHYRAARLYAAGALVYDSTNPHRAGGGAAAGGGDNLAAAAGVWQRTAAEGHVRVAARLPHVAEVTQLRFSGDGRLLVTGTRRGELHLWGVPDGAPKGVLSRHAGPIRSLAVSVDGAWVVSTGRDRRARLWRVRDRQTVFEFPGAPARPVVCAMSHASPLVALGGADGAVALWDHRRRRVLWQKTLSAPALRLDFDRAGSRLLVATRDRRLRVLHARDGRLLAERQLDYAPAAVVFSPKGRQIAVGTGDFFVAILGADDLGERFRLQTELPTPWVSFAAGGRILIGAGEGQTRLFDLNSRELVEVLPANSAFQVRAAPVGDLFATAGLTGDVRLWRLRTLGGYVRLVDHARISLSVAFAPDGREVASAGWSGALRIWDATFGRLQRKIPSNAAHMVAVAYRPQGDAIVTASLGGAIQLWDRESNAISLFAKLAADQRSLAFTRDGQTLYACGSDGRIRGWDFASRRLRRTFTTGITGCFAVALSPDGGIVAAGFLRGELRLYRAADATLLAKAKAHDVLTNSVMFTPDGRQVISAGFDRVVRVWDVPGLRRRQTLRGHSGWVNRAVLSPDGARLLTTGDDHTARLWDTASWRPLAILKMRGAVSAAAFSPDGKRFAINDQNAIAIYPLRTDGWRREPRRLLQRAESETGLRLRGFRLVDPWSPVRRAAKTLRTRGVRGFQRRPTRSGGATR